MLKGTVIGIAEILGVAVSSMLVVFAILFILYVLVNLFPLVFRQGTPVEGISTSPAEDQDELLAVLTAAVQAFEEDQRHPIIRNFGDETEDSADLTAGNPLARNCYHQ